MSGSVNDSTKLQNVDLNNTPLSDDTQHQLSSSPQPKKNWVKFDEENNDTNEDRRKEEYEDMSLDNNGNTSTSTSSPAILSPPPQAAKRSHARTSPVPSEQLQKVGGGGG